MFNIHVIRVSEGRRKRVVGAEKIFKELMVENFLILEKDKHLQIQRLCEPQTGLT